MKVLTFIGEDAKGGLQNYNIINPMNVVVTKGTVQKPGTIEDPSTPGQKIPVTVERTFIYIGGQPWFSIESEEEIIERIKEI